MPQLSTTRRVRHAAADMFDLGETHGTLEQAPASWQLD